MSQFTRRIDGVTFAAGTLYHVACICGADRLTPFAVIADTAADAWRAVYPTAPFEPQEVEYVTSAVRMVPVP